MDDRLDHLIDALAELDRSPAPAKATSLRLPDALHRAALIATELGMDESLTAATTRALTERVHAFARSRALAQHLDRFPADRPSLAAVVRRRVSGSDHPAATRPDLVAAVAEWVERRVPDWPVAGAVDETVDLVLDHVAMLASGVGNRRASA